VSARPERGITAACAIAVEGPTQRRIDCEVAIEEPLEIRVAGDAVALTMRTPGEDRYLALGFLHAEGVIESLADVGSVYHCGRIDDPRHGNSIEVVPGPGAALDLEQLSRSRRVGLTTSACGVCGRDGIDDLVARLPRRRDARRIDSAILRAVPELLSAGQANFARTGGLHAACAIDAAGAVLAHAEDVGRHNAVDKVVGKLLYGGQPGQGGAHPEDPSAWLVLAVSGRASFEIVQKAAVAGFACVASVSAPSSLAIETAAHVGLTLACFVRNGHYTLYAHADRVA
jgi:FdhD protein